MAARPLVLPDTFNGEGSTWTDWKFHFNNVASVNAWDNDQKLLWLKVRLTDRAQRAIQLLPADTIASFDRTIKALDERFEPASKKNLYQAEFQSRRKKRTESWADFADDLKTLVDKGYPDLGEDAREQISLHAYLQQLEPPQVAFSVKQKRPKTLVEAVTTTIETETYVKVISRHEGYIKTKPEGAVLIFPECTGYNQFMSRVTSVSGEFARGRGGKGCWSKRSSRRSFSCIGSDCG